MNDKEFDIIRNAICEVKDGKPYFINRTMEENKNMIKKQEESLEDIIDELKKTISITDSEIESIIKPMYYHSWSKKEITAHIVDIRKFNLNHDNKEDETDD